MPTPRSFGRKASEVVPEVIRLATDAFIARYNPTLHALAHHDLGHTIKWPEPDRATCSCGEVWESRLPEEDR